MLPPLYIVALVHVRDVQLSLPSEHQEKCALAYLNDPCCQMKYRKLSVGNGGPSLASSNVVRALLVVPFSLVNTVGDTRSAPQAGCSPHEVELRVSPTVFTNENGTTRSARTTFDEANYGPPFPTDNFLYFIWQHGSFKYARAHFSWCSDGSDSCTSRTRTRATMYKGGNILFG